MTRMRYKQVAKRNVEVALVVAPAQISRKTYKHVAKNWPGEGPIFGSPLLEIWALGFRYWFRFQGLGGVVSVTFWLRFLLQSRLVPVTSPENWFPLRVRKTGSRYAQNGSRDSPHSKRCSFEVPCLGGRFDRKRSRQDPQWFLVMQVESVCGFGVWAWEITFNVRNLSALCAETFGIKQSVCEISITELY